jgi:hypothetical protein
MMQAGSKTQKCNRVNKSAFAVVSIGYIVFWLPFWIILLPFNLLVWTWRSSGLLSLLLFVALIYAVVLSNNKIIDFNVLCSSLNGLF